MASPTSGTAQHAAACNAHASIDGLTPDLRVGDRENRLGERAGCITLQCQISSLHSNRDVMSLIDDRKKVFVAFERDSSRCV